MSESPPAKVHLLGLKAGDRFQLYIGKTWIVYEVQNSFDSSMTAIDELGQTHSVIEIYRRNGHSHFVFPFPGEVQ